MSFKTRKFTNANKANPVMQTLKFLTESPKIKRASGVPMKILTLCPKKCQSKKYCKSLRRTDEILIMEFENCESLRRTDEIFNFESEKMRESPAYPRIFVYRSEQIARASGVPMRFLLLSPKNCESLRRVLGFLIYGTEKLLEPPAY